MGKLWLIIRREYLERVRTKSFLISTILLQVFMFLVFWLPTRFATNEGGTTRHIVIVTDDPVIGAVLKQALAEGSKTGAKYDVNLISDTSEQERATLRFMVGSRQIDGFLWLTRDALISRKITFVRQTSDLTEEARLRSAITLAFIKQQLSTRGLSSDEIDDLMKSMQLDTVKIAPGGSESRTSTDIQWVASFILTMLLYITLLYYGVAVMRSVVEDKTSRVMEVMLSCVSPKELMAGKIIGVGAVGLTQMLIWIVVGVAVAAPSLLANGSKLQFGVSPGMIVVFGLFFVLGYVLYSAMYAALGAMVNSEQEATQWQFFVTLPLVVPVMMLTYVMREPHSLVSTVASVVPFFAPILMFVRMLVETPPAWQIILSIVLLLLTIYGALLLCSRVYRVGILMYGKRPTLPEIVKWMRYS
jgi:ABC-2 type transport system permease protein